MKINSIVFFLTLFASALFMESCSDSPTVAGNSYVYDTLSVYPLSSDIYSEIIRATTNYYRQEPMLKIPYNLIGFAPSADPDLAAVTFMRFESFRALIGTTADSLVHLERGDIQSVSLYMYSSDYRMGDTNTTQFAFDVYKIEERWDSDDDFTSVFPGGKNSMNTDDHFSDHLGEFNGTISITDSLPTMVKVDLKLEEARDLIMDMIKKQRNIDSIIAAGGTVDSLNIPDSLAIWGIGLVPRQGVNVLRNFYGSSNSDTTYKPYFIIRFKNDSGTEDSTKLEVVLDGTFFNCSPLNDDKSLAFQGFRTTRGELTFDLNHIPKFASIHRAELELTLDREKSYFGNLAVDSILYAVTFDEGRTGTVLTENYAKYLGSDKFIFYQFIKPLELWTTGSDTIPRTINLVPRETTVYLRPDRFVFFGADADKSKRPKLRVIYSVKPDFKKSGK